MNKSQRIILGVIIIGLIVAVVILFINNQLMYFESEEAMSLNNYQIDKEALNTISSDELLQDIEADVSSLESEYDFSADIDSELLLVPDFNAELEE